MKASKKLEQKNIVFRKKYSGMLFRNRYEHRYFAELAEKYNPKQNQSLVSTRWY